MFHPLIVPTTNPFSTRSGNGNPVSATDEGILPPGGFSLRHGFPHWFIRESKEPEAGNIASSGDVSAYPTGRSNSDNGDGNGVIKDSQEVNLSNISHGHDPSSSDYNVGSLDVTDIQAVSVAELLNYIKSTFDDEAVLDSLPLEAAGNSSAWHAWRAHRKSNSKSSLLGRSSSQRSPQMRRPGEWQWNGIWAKRTRDEIAASRSEATLFGNASQVPGDEMVSSLFFFFFFFLFFLMLMNGPV